jgi:dethiobiotin synthetase
MRLGCINQARLTWQAIRQTGVTCAGWVAVQLAPERCDYKANLAYLCTCLDIPLLGEMPYQAEADFDFLAKQLHLEHFDGLLYGYQDINKR